MSASSTRSEAAKVTEEELVYDLSNPDVTTKYTTGATIANKALEAVIAKCVDGADVHELCNLGDGKVNAEVGKVYNKHKEAAKKDDTKDHKKGGKKDEPKKMEKGVAFPTCISVNEVSGNFSPLKNESQALKTGDMVKIDLGVQIDGFIAQAAHTIVVGQEGKVTGRKADVLMAAHTAAEAALRTIQIGSSNLGVTQAIMKSTEAFKCNPVHGVLSHEVKRFVIDGKNVIPGRTDKDDDFVAEEFNFGLNQVYCVDILVSTGEGKVKQVDCRHAVYKRDVSKSYVLKTQKARQFIGEVQNKFPTLPFALRSISDETCARIGVTEANRHDLLHEYPVLTEKSGEHVAQFKFTVLLLPGGQKKITGLGFKPEEVCESEHKVEDEELLKLLATTVAKKNKRNKKKKDASQV